MKRLAFLLILLASAGYASAGGVTSASSGNVANAAAVATLPAIPAAPPLGAGQWKVTGVEITAAGATGASVVTATVTGLLGGTMSYTVAVPAGVTAAINPIAVPFNPPLDGIAGSAIVLTLPALGAGNTNAAVVIHGYSN